VMVWGVEDNRFIVRLPLVRGSPLTQTSGKPNAGS